jgi:hypothetical protein
MISPIDGNVREGEASLYEIPELAQRRVGDASAALLF